MEKEKDKLNVLVKETLNLMKKNLEMHEKRVKALKQKQVNTAELTKIGDDL